MDRTRRGVKSFRATLIQIDFFTSSGKGYRKKLGWIPYTAIQRIDRPEKLLYGTFGLFIWFIMLSDSLPTTHRI